jgi:hypothetical protein
LVVPPVAGTAQGRVTVLPSISSPALSPQEALVLRAYAGGATPHAAAREDRLELRGPDGPPTG